MASHDTTVYNQTSIYHIPILKQVQDRLMSSYIHV
jgi:hypothetical protein